MEELVTAIESSVLVFDIKNFTNTLRKFERKKKNEFFKFVEDICSCGYSYYRQLSSSNSDGIHFDTTGDGFLVIFGGKYHFITSYLFGLIFDIIAAEKFEVFDKNNENEKKLSYGMGIETGAVKKIKIAEWKNECTYIGNVINIASRIQSETRNHAKANLIISENVNQLLVKKIFNKNYFELRKKVKKAKSPEETKKLFKELYRLNQGLLLFHLSKHYLRGIDDPVSLFRLSPSLLGEEKKGGFKLIKRMLQFIEIENDVKKNILNTLRHRNKST
jgi:class 3 adenylate cyclase